MKALTLPEVGRVACEEVSNPQLQHSRDALVRVTTSAICGSDLHVYHGRIQGVEPGVPIGHEYVGIVESIGEGVRRFRPGDRVTGSFFNACGHCWACQRGLFSQCDQAGLFGFGPRFGGLGGTQAELVRIPDADYTLVALPEEISDEQGILVGDVLSTAYFAVQRGEIRPGDAVAVVGAGPVGLLAVELSFIFGAAQVIALDRVPDRLMRAESLGATPVAADANAVKRVRGLTRGRGADVVIEAVGHADALKLALQVARGFATISAAGVYTENALPVSMGRAFAKDFTLRAGMANVQAVFGPVIELLTRGRIHPERLVTHRLPLAEGPHGYQLFDQRQALKVLLEVSRAPSR